MAETVTPPGPPISYGDWGERVAAIIVNYNMPERTDALCRSILNNVTWPVDLIVVDNGSDLVRPSAYTTLHLRKNVQTTGGWNAGLEVAREKGNYFGYWFLITSTEFVNELDNLRPLAQLLVDDENAVGVHPALTEESTTAWKHMIGRTPFAPTNKPRRAWMIDNIASLWRAEWFDAQGGFDPALKYGWGIDFELCWKARQQGRGVWIHEGARVQKVTNIGYTMQRMNMSAEERVRLAGENMRQVLQERYGDNWNWKMRNEFVTDEMR